MADRQSGGILAQLVEELNAKRTHVVDLTTTLSPSAREMARWANSRSLRPVRTDHDGACSQTESNDPASCTLANGFGGCPPKGGCSSGRLLKSISNGRHSRQ